MDRLDGANAPSLTKKVQHHANVVTPAVALEQEIKQVGSGLFSSWSRVHKLECGTLDSIDAD